ncbi:MAG: hypothetical protein HYR84_11730 [Planctomycetes bacterium]|nr:hypothetical protein [Planctomycetota bacterium]
MLPTDHLATALKDGADPQKLKLTADEKKSLVMFLRSLDGAPLDPIVLLAK